MINPTSSFQQLVSLFEQNELELSQIPKNIVDRYGYACLANSLMFKKQSIPKYKLMIVEAFKKHDFKTLDSLISFIKKIKNDINKLFAIFAYAALNIEYDVDLFLSNRSRSTTLEKVFETKKAVCSGYSLFFQELAKRVGIDSDRIVIKEYSNFAKALGYDPLNAPKNVISNHSSVFISIDGVPYISEPTWASGNITNNYKFEKDFNPNYFLIPLHATLCNHFPCEESKELIQFNFPFKHFFQSINIKLSDRCLKTESHPFVNFTCQTGFLQQKYSVKGPIDTISFDLYKKNGKIFEKIDEDGITSYQIVQKNLPKHSERCRFQTNIAFPDVGFYKVELFIDTKHSLTYFVNNLKKCHISVPLSYNPFHDQKLIPIKPKNVLGNAKNGVIIRFAVSKKRSNLIWRIYKLKNEDSFDDNESEKIDEKYAKHIKLEIPFDNERYENQICVAFPTNGRYCVKIFLENDIGSFTEYIKYYFNITGVKTEKIPEINPVYYMFKGRTFAPLEMKINGNEVLTRPVSSINIVSERNQVFQFRPASKDDVYYFELRKNETTIEWPCVEDINDEFKQIKFTIPDNFGEYTLECWVNDKFCISIPYFYARNNYFKEASDAENKILDDLRIAINKENAIENGKEINNKNRSIANEILLPEANEIKE